MAWEKHLAFIYFSARGKHNSRTPLPSNSWQKIHRSGKLWRSPPPPFFFFLRHSGENGGAHNELKNGKKRYHVMRNSSCHHEKNVFCWWYHEEFIMISWGIAHYVILPYDLVRIRWSLHTMSKLKKNSGDYKLCIRNSIFGDLNLFQNAMFLV